MKNDRRGHLGKSDWKNPEVEDYGMGFSGRTGHRYRWKSRGKGTVVGARLNCSEHSNHPVPTSMAEKVGAEQPGPRMEREGYRTYRAQVF